MWRVVSNTFSGHIKYNVNITRFDCLTSDSNFMELTLYSENTWMIVFALYIRICNKSIEKFQHIADELFALCSYFVRRFQKNNLPYCMPILLSHWLTMYREASIFYDIGCVGLVILVCKRRFNGLNF